MTQGKTRKRKSASIVSSYLRQQYGIRWRDISSKLRSGLLHELEHVACNLCGADDAETVAQRDKYNLDLTSVICRNCGLIYLNPRPAETAYGKFYEEGGGSESVYHRQIDFNAVDDLLKFYYGPDFQMSDRDRLAMERFMENEGVGMDCLPADGVSPTAAARGEKADGLNPGGGEDDDACGDEDEQQDPSGAFDYYAAHLYGILQSHVPKGGKVFEPGASSGKLLVPWARLHECDATGVEPKREAVKLARDRYGIELLQGFANDPRIPENTYDLVINSRTINHMLDPLGDLRNAWRWLKSEGILFVDIQDVIRETRFEGFQRNVVEIDHPYMFSQNSLAAMVRKAGFEILSSTVQDLQQVRDWDTRAPQVKQIRIIARKSVEPVAVDFPDPLAELSALMLAQLEFDASYRDRSAERLRTAQKRLSKAESRLKKLKSRKGGESKLDKLSSREEAPKPAKTSLPARIMKRLVRTPR